MSIGIWEIRPGIVPRYKEKYPACMSPAEIGFLRRKSLISAGDLVASRKTVAGKTATLRHSLSKRPPNGTRKSVQHAFADYSGQNRPQNLRGPLSQTEEGRLFCRQGIPGHGRPFNGGGKSFFYPALTQHFQQFQERYADRTDFHTCSAECCGFYKRVSFVHSVKHSSQDNSHRTGIC